MNSNLKKIIMTALFAALACVATMSIRIPTPGTGGYIHPGDAIVILAGIILGKGNVHTPHGGHDPCHGARKKIWKYGFYFLSLSMQ